MNDKFKDVPVDKDTKILFESTMKFDIYDILYQKWYWDNIYGQSIIFVSEDVKDISDDELVQYISQSDIVKDKDNLTVSRSKSGFTFVNFDFVIKE